MATDSYILNSIQPKGHPQCLVTTSSPQFWHFAEKFAFPHGRISSVGLQSQKYSCSTLRFTGPASRAAVQTNAFILHDHVHVNEVTCVPIGEKWIPSSDILPKLVLVNLDPATAKLAIGVLGPFFSAFSFLFILRIVMSWYPKLPLGKFPYVIAYAPTEPFLVPTRKLIPPLGGVDISPVVWFGLITFLNEILIGPQGLLVLLSQQV